jgi:hypothetical protein
MASVSAHTEMGEFTTDQNKNPVRDFYELAFNQHKPREAVKKYVGDPLLCSYKAIALLPL